MPELFADLRERERKADAAWLSSDEHAQWRLSQYMEKHQPMVLAIRAEVRFKVVAHIALMDLREIGAALVDLYLNREIDRLTRGRLPAEAFNAAAGCRQTDVRWELIYDTQIEALITTLTPKVA